MTLIILILIAAVLYGLFGFFVARSSSNDAYLMNAVFNGLGGLLTLMVFGYLYRARMNGPITKQGVLSAVIAGVLIAAFSVLLVKIFARGGNLAYVMPAVYGGAIVVGSLLGIFILKESVSPLQLAGLVSIIVGIALVVISKL